MFAYHTRTVRVVIEEVLVVLVPEVCPRDSDVEPHAGVRRAAIIADSCGVDGTQKAEDLCQDVSGLTAPWTRRTDD